MLYRVFQRFLCYPVVTEFHFWRKVVDPVWQIQGVPRTQDEIDETGYVKSIVFVRKGNYVVIRAVNWLEKAGRLKYMDVKKLELIDGIWVPTEIHMTTKKGRETLHKTILKIHDVRFGQDLDAGFFSVRQLEKGLQAARE